MTSSKTFRNNQNFHAPSRSLQASFCIQFPRSDLFARRTGFGNLSRKPRTESWPVKHNRK